VEADVRPSIGRIVVFHSLNGDQPAIITAAHGEACDLTTFPRGKQPQPVAGVRQGEGRDCWSWPTREEA
jgi:hypothetical protein